MFAILRIQKHSSLEAIKRSGKHKDREQPTPNANPELTPANETEGAKTSDELVVAVQKRVCLATVKATGSKPVIAVEYLITASPEFFQNSDPDTIDAYFDNAKTWLRRKHGVDNVVSITRHNDEKSPHLSAFVVPLVERQASTRKRSVIVGKNTDGKPIRENREYSTEASINLSAKNFFGGAKALNEMQTDFYKKVAVYSGLQRGIEGSKATHQRVKQFYANITRGEPEILDIPKERKTLKKGMFSRLEEDDAAFAERVARSVKDQLAPVRDIALVAAQKHREAKEATKTALELKKRLEPFLGPLKGLSPAQVAEVVALAKGLQQKNDMERQEKMACTSPRKSSRR